MLPILIFIMFIFSSFGYKDEAIAKNNKLAVFGFVLFLIVFFTCLGVYSPFSYFMYITPIFGKTHLYTRYLIPLTLLLFIAVAVMLDRITQERERNIVIYKRVLFIFLMTLVILGIFSYLETTLKGLTSGYFILEILLVIIFVSCLILIKNQKFVIFITTLLIFSTSLTWFYNISFGDLSNKQNKIIYDQVNKNYQSEDNLVSYLQSNSEREIVKIVDITPGFSEGYLLKNVTWLLKNKS